MADIPICLISYCWSCLGFVDPVCNSRLYFTQEVAALIKNNIGLYGQVCGQTECEAQEQKTSEGTHFHIIKERP